MCDYVVQPDVIGELVDAGAYPRFQEQPTAPVPRDPPEETSALLHPDRPIDPAMQHRAAQAANTIVQAAGFDNSPDAGSSKPARSYIDAQDRESMRRSIWERVHRLWHR